MIWLNVAWQTFKGSRNVQVATVLLAGLIAFAVWLWIHDAGVRKVERERLEERAKMETVEATKAADAEDAKQKEIDNATLNDVRNASSTDEWFELMRERQRR